MPKFVIERAMDRLPALALVVPGRDRPDARAHRLCRRALRTCLRTRLSIERPCWEGIAGRGLGLVAMMRGVMVARSAEILLDTLARSARLPDTYFWGKAYVLDALCRLGVPQGMAPARHWVEQLMDTAARAGMRELVVRAHLHREGLGDRGGAGTARVLALEIDNPMLTALTARSAIRPRNGVR